jgi:hypothetical protein
MRQWGENEAKCRRRSASDLREKRREERVNTRAQRFASHAAPKDPSQPLGASGAMPLAGQMDLGFRARGSLPVGRGQHCALACARGWRPIHGSRADRGQGRRCEAAGLGQGVARGNRYRLFRLHGRIRREPGPHGGWRVLDQLCRREREIGGRFGFLRGLDIRTQRVEDTNNQSQQCTTHHDGNSKAPRNAAGTDHRWLSYVFSVVAHDAHVGPRRPTS